MDHALKNFVEEDLKMTHVQTKVSGPVYTVPDKFLSVQVFVRIIYVYMVPDKYLFALPFRLHGT